MKEDDEQGLEGGGRRLEGCGTRDPQKCFCPQVQNLNLSMIKGLTVKNHGMQDSGGISGFAKIIRNVLSYK